MNRVHWCILLVLLLPGCTPTYFSAGVSHGWTDGDQDFSLGERGFSSDFDSQETTIMGWFTWQLKPLEVQSLSDRIGRPYRHTGDSDEGHSESRSGR